MNWVIFTFNTRDFALLHKERLSADRHHAGFVVSGQGQVGLLVRRLLKLADTLSAEEMQDRLEFLGNWR